MTIDITNIPKRKTRTREVKDATGKRVRIKEDYWGVRPVKVVYGFDRFSHAFVDWLAITLINTAVSFVMYLVSELSFPFSIFLSIMLGVLFTPTGWFIAFAYYAIFEWKFASTPGKMLFKRTILMKSGAPPDPQTTLIRTLVRFLPFETFSCFSDRGWHDRFSESYVVSIEERDEILAAMAEAKANATENSILQT